ncbi:hypothetical protein M427DRAFT_403214 [Gonapodya prolifera JEL478]|uniref:Uncharacterized protein n=1 Tax=Gonapodya prolifera (strain JEL478) TaxID=1344416 RepID=A0A139ATT2_GONPJ|nr:hypothetical protein M427DRAFT_403214 [Gonapodya prolifera JEL478]|eukprot:KXS20146.1 hypothetical protein M427DRAFT_403214 [Gonapodya prolifera JEL478]
MTAHISGMPFLCASWHGDGYRVVPCAVPQTNYLMSLGTVLDTSARWDGGMTAPISGIPFFVCSLPCSCARPSVVCRCTNLSLLEVGDGNGHVGIFWVHWARPHPNTRCTESRRDRDLFLLLHPNYFFGSPPQSSFANLIFLTFFLSFASFLPPPSLTTQLPCRRPPLDCI